jgi:hypothetical protein
VQTPKGFGKNYFSLVSIQAYASLKKILDDVSSVCTLSGKPLLLSINAPPPFFIDNDNVYHKI